MRKLQKILFYRGRLKLLSGLHIGAEKTTVEIGGLDNPVVRCTLQRQQPYIPGSSLKGKMRALLQRLHGEVDEKQTGSPICQLFGAGDNQMSPHEYAHLKEEYRTYLEKNELVVRDERNENGHILLRGHRSRLLVRDAYLTEDSLQALEQAYESGACDQPYTEIKTENRIDRLRGVAEHPRSQERIPAGVQFDVEFILHIYENDDEEKLKQTFQQAIHLLNNDYLGGSGSRGYGKVEIVLQEPQEVPLNGPISQETSASAAHQ